MRSDGLYSPLKAPMIGTYGTTHAGPMSRVRPCVVP
jgi:hypothetical protein